MAFKMKGFPTHSVSALKKKNTIKENKFDVDKLADADDQRFLDRQREERVKYSELDAKGKAIYNKNRQKSGLAPLKRDRTPGSQNPNFPDVVYTIDGKAVKSINIDEEGLDLRPSIGPKGKFVNYTENGKKIKYYYKNPKKSPDQAKFSDLEKFDEDKG
tara:strand:+ start:266 stop:742 length:477 start_codon:yes stop_codon:yes gene_type:complete